MTTTAQTLLTSAAGRRPLVMLGAVLVGTALLAASAKVQVPFWPVPMTMQTTVVLMIGMAYGMRLGLATVGLYLLEGFAGLPVFAGPAAGPAYFTGPTAGYLVGFLAAAGFAGWMAERGWDRGWVKALTTATLAHVVIFAGGVAWLATLIGVSGAIEKGFVPFIAASVLKTVIAAALVMAAHKAVTKR